MPNEAAPRFLPNDKLTSLDVEFPARVAHLMPPLPLTSYKRRAHCESLAQRWFSEGIDGATFAMRDGINMSHALRHIHCILRSYEPKHEHKIEAVGWLIDQWFEGVARGEQVLLRRETPGPGPHVMDPVRQICIYCHCGGGPPPTRECPARGTATPPKDDRPMWSDRDGLLDRALAAESALAELRAVAATWARDMRDIEKRGLAPRSWDIPLLEAIEKRSP